MDQLYLQVTKTDRNNEYLFSLESFLSLFIYKTVGEPKNIELNFIHNSESQSIWINVNAENIKFKVYDDDSDNYPALSKTCTLPLLIWNNDTVISGLCGVCRGILKNLVKHKTDEQCLDFCIDLLGYKSGCLLAPTACSILTKFCEIDIISTVNSITKQYNTHKKHTNKFVLPEELSRFESHMKQPIRTHNVYKLARNIVNKKNVSLNALNQELDNVKLDETHVNKTPRINKKRKPRIGKNTIQIQSNVPVEDLNIEHKFIEGHKITLADLLLFGCMNLIFEKIPYNCYLKEIIPLTIKWYNTIKKYNNDIINISYNKLRITDKKQIINDDFLYDMKIIENYSLYKSDPKRYKPKNRIYTRQEDVEMALSKLVNCNFEINSETVNSPGRNIDFNWDDVSFYALPEGGNLPDKRLKRKKEQLENLAREVIALSKDGDRIVDFCSGTGHLGILLAYKLPKCQIILLENKEESLNIAKSRATLLNLTNLLFFQCNLDYFKSDFEIGISLHACSVATDIVLFHCMARKKKFVCCPCCYGGIHNMPHIIYPRSDTFKNLGINYDDYIFIAHCADQTHDILKTKCNIEKSIQGEKCMDVIDSDRKIKAEELGYTVILKRLVPENCTPKNRLIIGVFNN